MIREEVYNRIDVIIEEMEKRYAEGDYITKGFINSLPSVTPQEPRWIPISERLPEPNTLVLISTFDEVHIGCLDVYHEDYFESKNLIEWYWDESEEPIDEVVVAWMPLPKAYKDGDKA